MNLNNLVNHYVVVVFRNEIGKEQVETFLERANTWNREAIYTHITCKMLYVTADWRVL